MQKERSVRENASRKAVKEAHSLYRASSDGTQRWQETTETLEHIPASAFQGLGLKARSAMAGSQLCFYLVIIQSKVYTSFSML